MSGDRSGYWGAVFGGRVSHWWLPGEGKDKSLCGRDSLPSRIGLPWGRPMCKRCAKALAMHEREDEK